MLTSVLIYFWSAVGYWIAGWFLFVGIERLSRAAPIRPHPYNTVSVIIPARNEEGNLPTLLSSLNAQYNGPDEIVVVDDNSEDRTAEIAEEYGCTVKRLTFKPDGWTGKAWACWNGAQEATSKLLLFLDADVGCGRDALRSLSAAWNRYGGLISVQPKHITYTTYEQLSAFFNIVAVAAAGRRGSFGPCMVCERKEYFRVGGHKSIKSSIVDDIALAKQFEQNGLPVTSLIGEDEVHFRMYPGGVKELFEGWTKNMASGALLSGFLPLVLLFLWFTGIVNSVLSLVTAGFEVQPFLLFGSLLVYGAYAVQISWLLFRIGRFHFLTPLFYPLFFVFFFIVFCSSLISTLFKQEVGWKGRRISVAGRKGRKDG